MRPYTVEMLPAIGDAIQAAGGKVYGQVPAEGGARQVEVASADLPLFVTDDRAWVAKVCGVTLADLEEYDRWERQPRCAGITNAGAACKRSLGNYSLNSSAGPVEFAARHRIDLCVVHG